MAVELLAALFVFVAVASAAALLLSASPGARAAERRLDLWRHPPASYGLDASDVLRREVSAFPALRSLLAGSAWTERAAQELEQAGLRLKVSEYLLLRILVAAVCVLVLFLVTQAGVLSFLLLIPVAIVGFLLPAWYVRLRRERRAAAISRQLVETLQLLSNALRSGFAFTQAVDLASKQLSPPIQDELTHFLRDNALGATADDALRAMAKRAGSYDLDMTVTAILVQRTTGGNLSEVLDNVAETMRERERIRGEIRGLTAHQRLTGLILSVYPAVLAVVFIALAPDIMGVLITDPLGRIFLAVGVGLQVIGALTMRRILAIDI